MALVTSRPGTEEDLPILLLSTILPPALVLLPGSFRVVAVIEDQKYEIGRL